MKYKIFEVLISIAIGILSLFLIKLSLTMAEENIDFSIEKLGLQLLLFFVVLIAASYEKGKKIRGEAKSYIYISCPPLPPLTPLKVAILLLNLVLLFFFSISIILYSDLENKISPAIFVSFLVITIIYCFNFYNNKKYFKDFLIVGWIGFFDFFMNLFSLTFTILTIRAILITSLFFFMIRGCIMGGIDAIKEVLRERKLRSLTLDKNNKNKITKI